MTNPLDSYYIVEITTVNQKTKVYYLYDKVDHTIILDVKMENLGDGANYPYVNPFVLEYGETVEIILNNNDPGKHPFHLHGHNFQTIYRSPKDGRPFDTSINPTFPKVPMRRDTILVNANGNAVLRFKADNPGVWLFHCHIEWHMDSGLVATIIEAPLQLRESKKRHSIPESHYATCRAARHLYEGNAGGNTENFLDLSNQNVPPLPLASGFQPRGIVALVFSAIAAVIGTAVIVWYGLDEIKGKTDEGE
ncbi:iron transport multicopper oxidase FET3 [Coccidioides immitis H538.4]|nr:iron transport multicopper oxidase FET3 [Coccidioides immitis RMSCC 3703]KMU82339.1 iron transport multicopper oxidase FET3 [Coccidioides immitis H538.4]